MQDPVDIVIVGGGAAGWTAARRAQQLGASVMLVEKAENGPCGGNTVYSGGVFHAAYMDPHRDPQMLYETMMSRTHGATRADTTMAWARNVGRAQDFLAAEGGDFASVGPTEFLGNVLHPRIADTGAPHRDLEATGIWKGMGSDRLIRKMQTAFVGGGGIFRGGVRATGLLFNAEGRIDGVRLEDAAGTPAQVPGRAVIIADGGFAANTDLMRRHVTRMYKVRGTQLDAGDGLLMALDAGATTANMGCFYGHALLRDSLTNEAFWPNPSPEPLIDAAIVVDGHGRRLADEWRGDFDYSFARDVISGPIAYSDTPGDCWVVFDRDAWEGPGRTGSSPVNPVILAEGGTLAKSDTVPGLAHLMQVPPETLCESVASFNGYCTAGTPIVPPRTGKPNPIATAPFMAIPLIAGVTFTMGGIVVNGNAQAIDADDRPIPGLYAAGGSMAGLHGGPNNAYAGGWSPAATFGLLAGEHAATLPVLAEDSSRR